MKAIIIDDETASINSLKLLIEKHVPDVNVVAVSTEGGTGIPLIEQYRPDIVFLDISMPDMNGFSMVEKVKYKDFNLVFTTAYERYAIQAIKHHASDYLVKPVDIDELKLAIDNIRKLRLPQGKTPETKITNRLEITSRIGLPVKEGVVYHSVADIIWIQSDGNYCTFHTNDQKKYMVAKNIGEFEEILPIREFFRIHKSYLINTRKVKKYIRSDGYYVEMQDGAVVEISRRKKDDFLHLMNEIN